MLLRLLTLFFCVNLSINSEKTTLTLSQLTSTNALLERATIKINTAAIPKTSQIKYSPVDPAPHVHEQWYNLVIQADQKTWNVSVPSTYLEGSNFKEQITIHLDKYSQIYHIDYLVPFSASPAALPSTIKFNPKIKLQRPVDAPRPVLETIPELNPQGKLEKEEPKSFLQKYWIYIIPVLVILLMSGGGEEGTGAAGPRA